MDNRPIGVFDSGIGGLTVAKEIMEQLPNEKIIYFGDTARLPYGSKSKDTIIKYSNQIIRFLQTKNVKAIVIACGTASTNVSEVARMYYDTPIIGVVEPGVSIAVNTTVSNKIGIIGTEATVNSKSYETLINHLKSDIIVYTKACPLFVPLVEEGWINDTITYEIACRYLKVFMDKEIDTLVLGCTHYPLLIEVLAKAMGESVVLVNPAYETAKRLSTLLKENKIYANSREGSHKFYVSDMAEKFEVFAKRILNKRMMPVKKIDIEAF